MGKITRDEGVRIAEREAWAARGRKNSGWYSDGHRLVKPVAIGAGLLVLSSWAWNEIKEMSFDAPDVTTSAVEAVPVPGVTWALTLFLVICTIIFMRTAGNFRRFGMVVAGAALLLAGWIAVGWIGISTLL